MNRQLSVVRMTSQTEMHAPTGIARDPSIVHMLEDITAESNQPIDEVPDSVSLLPISYFYLDTAPNIARSSTYAFVTQFFLHVVECKIENWKARIFSGTFCPFQFSVFGFKNRKSKLAKGTATFSLRS